MKFYIPSRCFFSIFFLLMPLFAGAAIPCNDFFVIPLGVNGGLLEDNLSAYLLAGKDGQDFILLDAGTVMSGLMKPATQKSLNQLGLASFTPYELAVDVLKNHIKAYLISHAHLDHIAGLVIASPEDTKKEIFGIETTLNYLKENIFNWKVWPNFADAGAAPFLAQYRYVNLPIAQSVKIDSTLLSVEAMPLSHCKHYPSTAFLIHSEDACLLYFGDTGADELEDSKELEYIWGKIAPLIISAKLKAIFIEVSFPNSQPDAQLFGHLNPKWLLAELSRLASMINEEHPEVALRGVPVVVTHIKPGIQNEKSTAEIITDELNSNNHLGVKFIIPKQGQLLAF